VFQAHGQRGLTSLPGANAPAPGITHGGQGAELFLPAPSWKGSASAPFTLSLLALGRSTSRSFTTEESTVTVTPEQAQRAAALSLLEPSRLAAMLVMLSDKSAAYRRAVQAEADSRRREEARRPVVQVIREAAEPEPARTTVKRVIRDKDGRIERVVEEPA